MTVSGPSQSTKIFCSKNFPPQFKGIHDSVFVQVYHDCPEEIDWVYKQFQVRTSWTFLLNWSYAKYLRYLISPGMIDWFSSYDLWYTFKPSLYRTLSIQVLFVYFRSFYLKRRFKLCKFRRTFLKHEYELFCGKYCPSLYDLKMKRIFLPRIQLCG